MLFKNNRTGKIVEFIERLTEKIGELSSDDRMYFKTHTLTENYCDAGQWEADYEPLGEGSLCPCCGMPIIDKGNNSKAE